MTKTSDAPAASHAACIAATSSGARGAGCVALRHQERTRVGVEAHRAVGLHGPDRRLVHQLEHRGPQRATDRDHRLGGRGHGREGRDERRADDLRRHQAHHGARDDAERALAADEELEQRQPGDVLDARAAERDQGAVGEHHVEAEDVVGGHAVLHAAQAAGVGGDVAADGADLVRTTGRVDTRARARRPRP